jgi:hypothetical protein
MTGCIFLITRSLRQIHSTEYGCCSSVPVAPVAVATPHLAIMAAIMDPAAAAAAAYSVQQAAYSRTARTAVAFPGSPHPGDDGDEGNDSTRRGEATGAGAEPVHEGVPQSLPPSRKQQRRLYPCGWAAKRLVAPPSVLALRHVVPPAPLPARFRLYFPCA